MLLPRSVGDLNPLDGLRAGKLARSGQYREPRDQGDEKQASPHRARG